MELTTQAVKVWGRTFIPVIATDSCHGCVALSGAPNLCSALPECSSRTEADIIFKEVE